jgi:hypothetical protein
MPGVNKIVGRQRALWVSPGGKLMVNGNQEDIAAVLIESGTAYLDPFFASNDSIMQYDVTIPVFRVPPGGDVLKAVALATLATIAWSDSADFSLWGIDETSTLFDPSSRDFSVVAHCAYAGKGSGALRGSIGRVGYHLTVYLKGAHTFGDPAVLADLENSPA